jgi:hypothetical protein
MQDNWTAVAFIVGVRRCSTGRRRHIGLMLRLRKNSRSHRTVAAAVPLAAAARDWSDARIARPSPAR